jgi:hypothetical protein
MDRQRQRAAMNKASVRGCRAGLRDEPRAILGTWRCAA